MTTPIHIYCPSVVSLTAHSFTAIGLKSGARQRAFLTHRPNAQRMAIPRVIKARRELERHFCPVRIAEDCRRELHVETARRLINAFATIAVIIVIVAVSLACTGLVRIL